MTRAAQLARLSRVTAVRLAASQAQLAEIRRREATLARALADLSASGLSGDDPTSPAARAGADLLWQRWAEARRREIHMELARLRAAGEDLRADLVRAHGQDRAVSDLADQACRRALQDRARRSERDESG
jgi:hypothetical protein